MEYLIVSAADRGGPYEKCIREQRAEHGEKFHGILFKCRGGWHENTKCKPAAVREAFKLNDVVFWVDADCYIDPPESLPEGDWDICVADNFHPHHKLKISAAFILFRKTKGTERFLNVWELFNRKERKDHPAFIKTIKATKSSVKIKDMTSWVKGRQTINRFLPERGQHFG